MIGRVQMDSLEGICRDHRFKLFYDPTGRAFDKDGPAVSSGIVVYPGPVDPA